MYNTIKSKSTMNIKDLKMIPCVKCGEPMPELRLTKYGYNFCVKCSEAGLGEGRKQGVPILMGEGDHTWVETVIMTDEQFRQYERQQEAELNLDKKNKAEIINMDKDDDKNLIGPMTIKDPDGK